MKKKAAKAKPKKKRPDFSQVAFDVVKRATSELKKQKPSKD